MAQLIPPHGGKGLTICLLEGAEREAELAKAKDLKQVAISPRVKGDLIMIGIGGFSPLTGFMTKADWKGVCEKFLMADGTFWPVPVTLDVTQEDADAINEGDEIALYDPEGDEIMATMKVTEKYALTEEEKIFECEKVYMGPHCRGVLEDRQRGSSRRPDGNGSKSGQPGRSRKSAQRRQLSHQICRCLSSPG